VARLEFLVDVEVAFGGRTHPTRIGLASDGTMWIELFGRRFAFEADDAGFAARLPARHGEPAITLDLASALRTLGLGDVPGADALPPLPLQEAAILVGTGDDPVSAIALTLEAGLDLHDLPLVGPRFAPGAYGLAGLTVAFASAEVAPDTPAADAIGRALPKGASISGLLDVGPGAQGPIDAPLAPAAPEGATPAPETPAPGAGLRWRTVDKSLGPVALHRIGFAFADGVASLAVDLSVAAGPIRLDLLGAGLGLSFAPSDGPSRSVAGLAGRIVVHPRLEGLGVAYSAPPVAISGALRRKPSEGLRFDGALTITAARFSIAAIGSYEQIGGSAPSFFVFGVLDAELGGPPIFRVTGLAAGFGLNRSFDPGPVEAVADHPLIAAAAKPPPGGAADLLATMSPKIDAYLRPRDGALWFSVGVKGNSFGLIDSIFLLTVALGEEVTVSVLGLSTLVIPPRGAGGKAVPPLAKVVLQVKAEVAPAVGTLSVEARIAGGSYVFSPDCHLTGGFAFRTWFKGPHAGDFAVTLGGWHPAFRPPAHYPDVPRVALSWAVTPNLAIHGELYFGLTPSCVMAGGSLSARYARGHLSAWFDLEASFLMEWEPFRYSIHVSVRIGARYVVTIDWGWFGTSRTPISIHLSTEVHIWGPAFGGVAHVDWTVISFTIPFGAGPPPPPVVDWTTVKARFLPPPDRFVALAVTGGLVSEMVEGTEGGRKVQVVSPQAAAFELRLPVPVTSYRTQGGTPVDCSPKTPLGVRPMAATGWAGDLTYQIVHARHGTEVGAEFAAFPITSGVPAALWGAKPAPKGPSADAIPGVATGLALALRPRVEPVIEGGVPISVYRMDPIDDRHFDWSAAAPPSPPLTGEATRAAVAAGPAFGPDPALLEAAGALFEDLRGGDVVADVDLLEAMAGLAFQAMPTPETVGAPIRQTRATGA
jgi:hypothetical protein